MFYQWQRHPEGKGKRRQPDPKKRRRGGLRKGGQNYTIKQQETKVQPHVPFCGGVKKKINPRKLLYS